jgi:hypothetical protein
MLGPEGMTMKINRRVDHLNALFVDAAITVCEVHGELAAVRVLLDRGIDHEVILRVLSKPASRRTAIYRPLYR